MASAWPFSCGLNPTSPGAERYATAAATPGSVLFHHYLSPAGYTARFAASHSAVSAAESWLRGEGFTGVTADSGRAYVRATGPVSTINAAFGIRLTLYRPSAAVSAGRYRLRPTTVPSGCRARWPPACWVSAAWTTPTWLSCQPAARGMTRPVW